MLLLSSCSSAQNDSVTGKNQKELITGNYYTGTTADKIQYGKGPTAVDQAIGDANKPTTPCTIMNEAVTTLPVSTIDTGTFWFFPEEPKLLSAKKKEVSSSSSSGEEEEEDASSSDEEEEEDASSSSSGKEEKEEEGAYWKQTNYTFKFDDHKAIQAPRQATHIYHWPDEKLFNAIYMKQPANMFNDGPGYSTTYLLEPTNFDGKLSNNKSVVYRVTLSHLGRFWCCSQKQNADTNLEEGSPYQLFKPDDKILGETEVPAKGLLGFAGTTGFLEELNSGVPSNFVNIKLEYYYGSVANLTPTPDKVNDVQWKDLTFEEFWIAGPNNAEIQSYLNAP